MTDLGRILVMDDIQEDVTEIVRYLKIEGYRVDYADSINRAIQYCRINRYDVAILDVLMKPEMKIVTDMIFGEIDELSMNEEYEQGFGVAAWVRANSPETGVIMLTKPRFSDTDMVYGLEQGADDYIGKTELKMPVFAARVRALVRRCRPFDENQIPMKGFTILVKSQKIQADSGLFCYLTDAEFMTMKKLAENKNRYVSREEIHDYALIDRGPDRNLRSVDTIVVKLREKIAKIGVNDGPIRTIRGRGYLLEVPEMMPA